MQASNNCHGCGNHVQNAKNAQGGHNRHVHEGHHKHAGFGKFMEKAQEEEKQAQPEQTQAKPEQPQTRPEQPQAQHEHHECQTRVVFSQPIYCHLVPLHHVHHVHPVHNMRHAHHGHHAQLHGNEHSKGGSEDSNDLLKIMKSIAKMMQSGELTMQDLKDAANAPDKKDSSSIKQILEEFWNMVKNDEELDIAGLLSKIKQLANEEGKTEQSVA